VQGSLPPVRLQVHARHASALGLLPVTP